MVHILTGISLCAQTDLYWLWKSQTGLQQNVKKVLKNFGSSAVHYLAKHIFPVIFLKFWLNIVHPYRLGKGIEGRFLIPDTNLL